MNDFFATTLLNPDKSLEDLIELDITPSNTSLKTKEDYINVPQVQEAFKKLDGTFDNDSYDKYYESTLHVYNKFVNEDFINNNMDSFNYGPNSTAAASIGKREEPGIYLRKISNPTAKTYGLTSVFGEGKDLLSYREAALRNRVWDYENNKWLDWTPNDDDRRGLIDFFLNPKLVMATWDEDGKHEEDGRMMKHYKGQYKTDESGNPYYETLGNRDFGNKEMLHLSDTMTVDGSSWNTIDIFDSDGLDKSVTKTVASTVASIVPYFIPYFNTAYKWAQVADGAGIMLSAAGRAASDIVGNNKGKMWQYANNLGAFTESTHSSLTDYAKQHMFGMEGILSIVKDSASLLYSQRMVSKVPGMLGLNPYQRLPKSIINRHGDEYLRKYGKTLKQAMRDGDINQEFMNYILSTQDNIHDFGNKLRKFLDRSRAMGSLYMAGVQTADVYNTMKDNNFNNTEIAAGMLGMYWGYYKLMQSSLGEVAIRNLGLEGPKRITRKFLNEITDTIRNTTRLTAMNNPLGRFKAIRSIANKISKYGDKYMANEFFADMVKEGVEEVSEEALADTWLGLISAADWALSGDLNRGANYNPFDTNILERYGSAFLGGFIGGAVFKGLEKMELSLENRNRAKHGETARELPKETLNDIITLVRNGLGKHIVQEIERQMRQGKIAPTQLSMNLSNHSNSLEDIAFESATTREESQNDQIGNYIINFVKSIDNIINDEGMALRDRDVLEGAFDRDIRAHALIESNIAKDVLNDFNNILTDLVTAKLDEQGATNTTDKTQIQQKIKLKEDELKQFIDGSKKMDLVERMLFEMNRSVSSGFYSPDIYLYAYSKGKQFNLLNAAELDKLREEFKALIKNTPDYKRVMYNAYKKLKAAVDPNLRSLSSGNNNDAVSLEYLNDLNKLLDALIETITGELSEDEIEELLQNSINDVRSKTSDEDLIKMLNTRQEVDFDLESALKDKILNSMEFQLAKYAALMLKVQENIYSNPISNKLGIDQLTTTILGNVNPENQISAYSNLDAILTAILVNIYNKIGFLDTLTRNKLKTIINAVYKINMFNLLSNIDINKAFDASGGNEISLDQILGFTGNDVINSNVKLVRELKDGKTNYYITGTVSHLDDIFGGDDVEISIPKHKRISLLYSSNYVISATIKEGDTNVVLTAGKDDIDLDSLSNDEGKEIVEIQYKIPLDPDRQNEAVTELIKKKFNSGIKSYANIDPNRDQFLLKYLDGDLTYQSFLEAKKKYDNMSNHKNNPILLMLSAMSKEMTGVDVLEIFAQEESNYMNSDAIFNYVINNDITKLQLEDASNVINALKSILVSQTKQSDVFDITGILNSAKRKVGINEDVELTQDQLMIILNELAKMGNKIDTLLQISEINAGNLIVNSKTTGINLNCNLLSILAATGPSPINPTYRDKDGKAIGFLRIDVLTDDEIDRLNQILESNDISEEAYKFTFEMLMKVNKDLYERYSKLTDEEKSSLRDSLAGNDFFDKTSNKSTNINKYSTTDDFDGDFLSSYIYGHCVVDVTEFYSKAYEQLLDPNQNAPFAGLLLSAELSYIYALEHKSMDEYIEKVKEFNKRQIAPIVRKNIFFTLGDAGSGKTRLVAAIVKNILILKFGNNKKMWYAGPRTETANQLSDVLNNSDPSVILNKDELFARILTEDGLKKFHELQELEKLNNYKFDPNDFNDSMFNQDIADYIFIDEITLFSDLEQRVLQTAIQYKNPQAIVFAYGDKYQNGIVDNTGDSISCNKNFLNEAPYLNMSVRFNNTTKQDNCIKLLSILKVVLAKYNDSIIKDIPFDATDYYEQLIDIPFKYYEDDKVLHGEKIINTSVFLSEVENLVNKLEDGQTLAYIHDATNPRYNEVKKLKDKYGDKIRLIDIADVLGAEYNYAVVDINFHGVNKNNLTSTFISELKSLYTLITRSKLGTLIVDNNNLLIKNNIKTPVSREVKLPLDELQEYSNFVKSSLPGDNSSILTLSNPNPTTNTVSPTSSTDKEYTQVYNKLGNLNVSEQDLNTEEYRLNHTRISSDLETEGSDDENFHNTSLVDSRGVDLSGRRIPAVKVLKGFLLNNDWTSSNFDISDYVYGFIKNLFQNSSKEDIINILKTGKTYIKVAVATENDVDPRLKHVIDKDGQLVYNDKQNIIGSKVAKLVFRVKVRDNYTDLVLGYLSNDTNIDIILKAKESIDTTPVYLSFDKDALFNKNSTHIKYRLDKNRTLNGTPFSKNDLFTNHDVLTENSLKKLKLNHPELIFTKTLINVHPYIDRNSGNVLMAPGVLFVLVSSNPNADPEDLIRRFDAYYSDDSVDISDIGVLYVQPIGITFAEYKAWWTSLFVGNSNNVALKKHSAIAGITTASKFSLLLHMLYNRLSGDDKLVSNNYLRQTIIDTLALDLVIEELTGNDPDKKNELKEIIQKNFLNFESIATTSTSDKNVKFDYYNYFERFKLNNVLSQEELVEFNNVLNEKGLTPLLSLNLLIDILTIIKERQASVSQNLEKLLEYLNKLDSDIQTLFIKSGVTNFLQLAELGMIPPLLKNVRFINNLMSKSNNSDFANIIQTLMYYSNCFKYGILLAPLNTVQLTSRNSLFDSASSDDDVFVNVMPSTGSVYFLNDDSHVLRIDDINSTDLESTLELEGVSSEVREQINQEGEVENMPIVTEGNQPSNNIVTSNLTQDKINNIVDNCKKALNNQLLKEELRESIDMFWSTISILSASSENDVIDQLNNDWNELIGHAMVSDGYLLGSMPKIEFKYENGVYNVNIVGELKFNKLVFLNIFNDVVINGLNFRDIVLDDSVYFVSDTKAYIKNGDTIYQLTFNYPSNDGVASIDVIDVTSNIVNGTSNNSKSEYDALDQNVKEQINQLFDTNINCS